MSLTPNPDSRTPGPGCAHQGGEHAPAGAPPSNPEDEITIVFQGGGATVFVPGLAAGVSNEDALDRLSDHRAFSETAAWFLKLARNYNQREQKNEHTCP